ncbi:nuclease [Citrobacter freundii]|uniref:thermonuclease family protein n=1 Tax=Gammaproteobacteria TaxID=1236 RepID=UPI0005CF9EDB|nr:MULTISPECIES: thermonuclease family protein [Gammaproteobacteria]EEA2350735.1 nuclease [Salmonella enterica subsp. enterica serovar Enteritidis]EES8921625.1 thermonuclease family protein [Escherichia coli]MBD5651605.1 thermonuclease family protein [Citrobacter freundii]CSX10551.1 protein ParB [Shigella sonnei]EEC4304155.1 nuclease [Salmonella enterica subsp. enterica serovar Enteritidis]
MRALRYVIVISAFAACSVSADVTGKVVRVLDGDTVDVLSGQRTTRVRLYGIDAPEKAQAYGQRSRQALTNMVAGKTVTAVGDERDVYGRLLATIMLDTLDINAMQVSDGMAWAYRYKGRVTIPDYLGLEQQAKAAERGLWAQPGAVAPWEWRKQNIRN